MVKIREEIEKWQASISTMTETIASLQEQLAAEQTKPSRAAEQVTAMQEQVVSMRRELENLKASPPQPAPNVEVEKPIPETPPEILSDPKTRAQKVGWV